MACLSAAAGSAIPAARCASTSACASARMRSSSAFFFSFLSACRLLCGPPEPAPAPPSSATALPFRFAWEELLLPLPGGEKASLSFAPKLSLGDEFELEDARRALLPKPRPLLTLSFPLDDRDDMELFKRVGFEPVCVLDDDGAGAAAVADTGAGAGTEVGCGAMMGTPCPRALAVPAAGSPPALLPGR